MCVIVHMELSENIANLHEFTPMCCYFEGWNSDTRCWHPPSTNDKVGKEGMEIHGQPNLVELNSTILERHCRSCIETAVNSVHNPNSIAPTSLCAKKTWPILGVFRHPEENIYRFSWALARICVSIQGQDGSLR